MILYVAGQIPEVEVGLGKDVGLVVLEDHALGEVGQVVATVAAANRACGMNQTLHGVGQSFADVVEIDGAVCIDERGDLRIGIPLVEDPRADGVLSDDLGCVVARYAYLLFRKDAAIAGIRCAQQRKSVVSIVFKGRLHNAAVLEHALIWIVGNSGRSC